MPFDDAKRSELKKAFQSCADAGEAFEIAKSLIAEAFPEAAAKVIKTLPLKAPALYQDRDKTFYTDPLSFYRDTWRQYEGNLYLDDLNRLDPKLAPAIRSYCQRMNYKDEDGNDLLPKNILPPVRPDRGVKITAEAGTVEHEVQRRKFLRRARDARRKEKIQTPSP